MPVQLRALGRNPPADTVSAGEAIAAIAAPREGSKMGAPFSPATPQDSRVF